MGNTQELMSIEEDYRKIKFLQMIERGCRDMNNLINNILDFSKLEAGKFTLENRKLAKENPALFLQRFEPPLLIDEIQYAPELLPYIKAIVDEKKQKGLFWITGSQQFHLMQGVSESLAGRIGILNLEGFSLPELARTPFYDKFIPTSEWISKRCKEAKKIDLKELFEII